MSKLILGRLRHFKSEIEKVKNIQNMSRWKVKKLTLIKKSITDILIDSVKDYKDSFYKRNPKLLDVRYKEIVVFMSSLNSVKKSKG